MSVNTVTISKSEYTTLLAERERFSMVLDGTRMGMWDWNHTTDDIVFDKCWCEMLGYE